MSTVLRTGAIVLLTGLYFAQGLPFGFFTQAVPVLMRDQGYSLTQISLVSILYLPWAIKFLWAPLVDRLGTRRRWLLTTQLGAAAVALALAATDLSESLRWLFVAIAIINLLSATQDVATDGLAVRMLDTRARGLGNAIQTGAYRVGMIAGGGVLLWVFAQAGWRVLALSLGGLILLCTIPVLLFAREGRDKTPASDAPTAPHLATAWWSRLRRPGVIALIGLLAAYKFGNSMASAISGPFLRDSGFSLEQIALINGALSSAGSLLGAAVGGFIAFRHGRRPALVIGGVAQTAAIVLYVGAAVGVGGFGLLVGASIAENVLGGAATVALFTLMMDSSEREFAGTDYTVLACAVVAAQGAAGFAGGVVGDAFGYPVVFTVATVISAAGCAVFVWALDRGAGPQSLTTWSRAARFAPVPPPAR